MVTVASLMDIVRPYDVSRGLQHPHAVQRDRVPDTDHISRYCGGARILPDGSISGAAFHLRGLEEYLSVNWLEYPRLGDRDSEIAEVRRVFGAKGRKLGTTARLAVLNTGRLRGMWRRPPPTIGSCDILHRTGAPGSFACRYLRVCARTTR